jgi:hypothetical protein
VYKGIPSRSTVTDEEGRFEFTTIGPIREVPANASSMEQWIRVQIEPPAPLLPMNRTLTAPSRRVEDLGDIRANRGRTIGVRVTKDGEPQQGRRITMEMASEDPYQFEPAVNTVTGETDAEGVARFDAVPEGRHRVRLDGTPYYQEIPPTTGPADLEFVLGTSRLVVRCLRGGKYEVIRSLTATRDPGTGFNIVGMHRLETTTDRLVLDELPAGDWTLRLYSPGIGSEPGSDQRTVTLGDGEEVEVVFVLSAGVISGGVLNSQQQPEENALVRAELLGSEEGKPGMTRISVTNRDGRFSLRGLPPGRWRLEVLNVPNEYAAEEISIREDPEQEAIERMIVLAPAKERVLFDVRCAETGVRIEDARVALRMQPFRATRYTPRRTSEGLWAFEGLAPTSYRFSATHPWRHQQGLDVTISEGLVETHVLRLEPAGTVHLSARVRDPGHVISRCVIRLAGRPEESPAIREFDLLVNATNAHEIHLAPGEYEVRMTLASGREMSQRFTITAEHMTRVRLEDDE